MNRNQFGARLQSYTFQGLQHREIGLRAVAAAILYQGRNAERTTSSEPSARSVPATPSNEREA
jgi:hypothetical protein